jgi:hypothetical protein
MDERKLKALVERLAAERDQDRKDREACAKRNVFRMPDEQANHVIHNLVDD